MRDIKFRTWDTVNKRFIHVSLGDLVCGACTNNGDKPLSGYKQVWEQFTGLYDINGKIFMRVISALLLAKLANI